MNCPVCNHKVSVFENCPQTFTYKNGNWYHYYLVIIDGVSYQNINVPPFRLEWSTKTKQLFVSNFTEFHGYNKVIIKTYDNVESEQLNEFYLKYSKLKIFI
jgi:hypothetical protein